VEEEQMSRTVSGWIHRKTGKAISASRVKQGFTLVELLVVIAIIGVLVGLLLPAVFGVRARFNRASVKFEVQALNDAVANYRSKYGDYPPDGSSWQVVESHLRKAFPNILQSELNLLNPTATAAQAGSVAVTRNDNDTTVASLAPINYRVMDPAEALVFFLGGFSSDSQRPFTGPGGPFVASTVSGQGLQYNGSRQNPMYEFPSNRLTLDSSSGALVSTDETVFGEGIPIDLMPVFMSKFSEFGTGAPYVYFDSRTYQAIKGSAPYYNFYQPSVMTEPSNSLRGQIGAARPFLSEQVNTSTSRLYYENKQSFQIISPGVDGKFGNRIVSELGNGMVLFTSKGKPTPVNLVAPVGFGPLPGSGPVLILPEHGEKRPLRDDACNSTDTDTIGENT